MKHNPKWQPEELQLALELYLSHGIEWLSRISDTTPEIVALSMILNGLDVVDGEKDSSFRSVGSIRMKLANFKALDPRYGKNSLSNGSKLDKSIWENYSDKYELLRKQCASCVKNHFHGKMTEEIKDYFIRLNQDNTSDDAIVVFAESLQTIDDLKNAAKKSGNTDLFEKCEQIEISIKEVLVQCGHPYQEHAGINQRRTQITKRSSKQDTGKAIPNDEPSLKIGKTVQQLVNRLIHYKLITESVLSDIVSPEWCSRNLHINHPLLRLIDKNIDLHQQTIDSKGYSRYYHETYTIDSKEYLLCKELYERQRKHFVLWEKTLKLDISKAAFIGILEYIKKMDTSSAFSISLQELRLQFDESANVDQVIDYLTNHHVLTSYQGSLREYVVDDYEILYLMIRSPQEYICEGE